MKLLLTLGPGLEPASEGHVLVLDWPTKRIVDEFCYRHQVYEKSHKGLAGASLRDGRLLVAGECEALEFDLAPLRLVGSRSFPFLNDVHHLAASKGGIWICNTGLDCLEEFDTAWQLRRTHQLVGRFGRKPLQVLQLLKDDLRKSWRRMRGNYDYYEHLTERPPFRNVMKLLSQNAYRRNGRDVRFSDFRPHVLHPNHVLPVGDDLWVTLWRTGEIVSLRQGVVLAQGLGRPHDGFPAGDELYVTDCHRNRLIVHALDRDLPAIGARIAEKVVTGHVSEGFLRGVAVAGDLVFVGLTARRGALAEFRTGRVVAMDRKSLTVLDAWTVPTQYGLQVYSVVDVTSFYG